MPSPLQFHVFLSAVSSEADGMVRCLACGAAAELDVPRESSADGLGVGGAPGECAAGPVLWGRRVGSAQGEAVQDGIHDAVPWATERMMKEKDSRPRSTPASSECPIWGLPTQMLHAVSWLIFPAKLVESAVLLPC